MHGRQQLKTRDGWLHSRSGQVAGNIVSDQQPICSNIDWNYLAERRNWSLEGLGKLLVGSLDAGLRDLKSWKFRLLLRSTFGLL